MAAGRLIAVLTIATLVLAGGCTSQRLRDSGDRAFEAHRPLQAVSYYQQALTHKPDLARDKKFAARFAQAKQAAAEQLLDRARDAATAGDLDDARDTITSARDLDPDNAAVATAAASLDGGAAADPAMAHAVELARQKRWLKAFETLEAFVQANPNHLRALVDFHRSRRAIREAHSLQQKAQTHSTARELGQAKAVVEQSLAIWPYNTDAAAVHKHVLGELARADEHYRAAKTHAAARRWSQSLAETSVALSIYPGHADAARLDRASRDALAADQTRQGQARLADGDLSGAEAFFAKALTFVGDYRPARRGLADAASTRARQAAAQGRHGAAMLWFRQGQAYVDDRAAAGAAGAAYRAVIERLSLDVAVADAHEKDPLTGRMIAEMMGIRPPWLNLRTGPGAKGAYVVRANLTRNEADRRQVSSIQRVHEYVIRQEHPNPRYDHLRAELHRQRSRLRTMRRKLATLRNQSDQIQRENDRRARGGPQRGGRDGSPTRPRENPYLGEARNWERIVDKQHRKVRDLERELQWEQPIVYRDVPARWTYVVHTWTVTANVEASVQLLGPAGAVVDAFDISRDTSQTDDEIERANPSLGLQPDSLVLPRPEHLQSSLLASAAREAAGRTIRRIAEVQMSAALAAAGETERNGDAEAALEHRVNAAVLNQAIDPQAARTHLRELQESLVAGR